MAFTGNFMTTSFKTELLSGIHAIGTTVVRAATPAWRKPQSPEEPFSSIPMAFEF